LNRLHICRFKLMLLLLRHVSSHNNIHPQGYLRKVVESNTLSSTMYHRQYNKLTRSQNYCGYVECLSRSSELPSVYLLSQLVSVIMKTGTWSSKICFGRGADKLPRKSSHVSKPEQESKARRRAVVVQNKTVCLWQELIRLMLMNFSVLLIAFCDIKAILYGSTITHKE